ncbi:hypothetical protein H4S02_003167 [Coemansia sp. RSA 2611]|nr:hypothetical protein H4S02_003167 [Coemansia sp. RSA 2611]
MADVKSIIAAVLGSALFAILVLAACSSRARVLQMAFQSRIDESRETQPRRRATAASSSGQPAEPACACQHNSGEPELPKYEPPPPAYAPPKIVVHDVPA